VLVLGHSLSSTLVGVARSNAMTGAIHGGESYNGAANCLRLR
jgi:hypothetical protein